MTASWPKTSNGNKEKGNRGLVTDGNDSDEEDEDDFIYQFYYRTKAQAVKNNFDKDTKFIALKTTDENTLETVLPGINGVIIMPHQGMQLYFSNHFEPLNFFI